MIRFLIILLILCISAASADDQRNIKLGFSGVLTGPYASFGNDAKNGILLAAKTTKHKYTFDFQDDGCDAKRSLANVQSFAAGNRPDAIIVLCMEALESAAKTAQRYGLPIFSIGSISDDILRRFDNVFPLYTYADTDVRHLVPYIAGLKTIKTLAVIYQETNIGDIIRKRFEDEEEASGYKVVAADPVGSSTMDYAGLVLRILKNNPDGVFVHLDTDNLPVFVKELRRIGYKGRVFSTFVFESDTVKKDQSPLLDDVVYPFPVGGEENSAENREFAKSFREEFHYEAPTYSKTIYDGMKAADLILDRCPKVSVECLRREFTALKEYTGIGGKVVFTPTGGALREYKMKRYKDHKFNWIQ